MIFPTFETFYYFLLIPHTPLLGVEIMSVFISWSGKRSKAIAIAIDNWLKNVIPIVETWFSAEDIDKGSSWFSEIAESLKNYNYAIVCLTPENQDKPWILFESGAIFNSMDGHVCTLLYNLQNTDVKGPLSHFQPTTIGNKEDMAKLVKTIYNSEDPDMKKKIPEDRIHNFFEKFWPDLEKELDEISKMDIVVNKGRRDPQEIADETLEIVRGIDRKLRTEELGSKLSVPQSFSHNKWLRGQLTYPTDKIESKHYKFFSACMNEMEKIIPDKYENDISIIHRFSRAF